jgi:methionine synthase II (cobalamin-independent)
MTTHRNLPFRAEHLGSLLRPKELLEKRAAFEKKGLSQEEIAKVEDEAITKVVNVQTEIGFRAVSDGEYR